MIWERDSTRLARFSAPHLQDVFCLEVCGIACVFSQFPQTQSNICSLATSIERFAEKPECPQCR